MRDKLFYGFEFRLGVEVDYLGAPHGDAGKLHTFTSKDQRDEWVELADNYQGRGSRRAYPSTKVVAHALSLGNYYGIDQLSRWNIRDLVDQLSEMYAITSH